MSFLVIGFLSLSGTTFVLVVNWSADILSASVRSTLNIWSTDASAVRASRAGGQDVRDPAGKKVPAGVAGSLQYLQSG
jgi:hypothetical protein